MSDAQIDELSSAINMKLGHKLKFAVILQEAREEKEEQEEERDEQKRKRRREKDERKREEEEQEEKRKRDKEEQEEQRKQEKELAHELSKIKREKILFEAKQEARTRGTDDHEHTDAKPKATEPTENTTATDPAQHQTTPLPAWKEFSAFISHKKMHTQFADSSETLSIRLKVHK